MSKISKTQAYKLGMYGENYAWFALDFIQPNWWSRFAYLTNCTSNEILQASKGYIVFSQSEIPLPATSQTDTIAGLVS